MSNNGMLGVGDAASLTTTLNGADEASVDEHAYVAVMIARPGPGEARLVGLVMVATDVSLLVTVSGPLSNVPGEVIINVAPSKMRNSPSGPTFTESATPLSVSGLADK
ncbi:MAG: hypothetical protein ACLPYS_14045 [Vulcanimicrobiaceae bacterium]